MGGFTLTVDCNGLIYAGSDDGYLCVVNPSGEEISRFRGDGWLSFPVIAADNTVMVSDANNAVWAITADGCPYQGLHRIADISGDGIVNFTDFAFLVADWRGCTDTKEYEFNSGYDQLYFEGDINRDRYVDMNDLAELAWDWLNSELCAANIEPTVNITSPQDGDEFSCYEAGN